MSLRERFRNIGVRDLDKANSVASRTSKTYLKVFPFPDTSSQSVSNYGGGTVYPHSSNEPHKKCCNVCIAVRYSKDDL